MQSKSFPWKSVLLRAWQIGVLVLIGLCFLTLTDTAQTQETLSRVGSRGDEVRAVQQKLKKKRSFPKQANCRNNIKACCRQPLFGLVFPVSIKHRRNIWKYSGIIMRPS